ncbi:hypothetical protein EMPG_13117 [Blastomyces silverae]|uniref:Uncharacterized protein n=1 Tax=Blastomyces silverae TaxID=2060906 RepID=A0A0H1BJZ8_9EURO|nr:hypothetical protein EMPG_13117 [Blastomyces silverae]
MPPRSVDEPGNPSWVSPEKSSNTPGCRLPRLAVVPDAPAMSHVGRHAWASLIACNKASICTPTTPNFLAAGRRRLNTGANQTDLDAALPPPSTWQAGTKVGVFCSFQLLVFNKALNNNVVTSVGPFPSGISNCKSNKMGPVYFRLTHPIVEPGGWSRLNNRVPYFAN